MLKRFLCTWFGHLPHGPVAPGDCYFDGGGLHWIQLPTYQCRRCQALLQFREFSGGGWQEVENHDITLSRFR